MKLLIHLVLTLKKLTLFHFNDLMILELNYYRSPKYCCFVLMKHSVAVNPLELVELPG